MKIFSDYRLLQWIFIVVTALFWSIFKSFDPIDHHGCLNSFVSVVSLVKTT